MDTALQLLLPMLAGFWLGGWLCQTLQWPAWLSLVFGLLGFAFGFAAVYNKTLPK
ncbi:MAG: AtpZ/AtpI family protein [Cyanobacteria bacterium]|nr:AtpZ/AtpI family protein [Cyanobacteriota bacterium]